MPLPDPPGLCLLLAKAVHASDNYPHRRFFNVTHNRDERVTHENAKTALRQALQPDLADVPRNGNPCTIFTV